MHAYRLVTIRSTTSAAVSGIAAAVTTVVRAEQNGSEDTVVFHPEPEGNYTVWMVSWMPDHYALARTVRMMVRAAAATLGLECEDVA